MIIVTTLADSGAGSLRQAIADATAGEEITFAVTGMILLETAELFIDDDLIITGPGSGSLSINPNGSYRAFNVNSGVVTISGLTIQSGAGTSEGAGIHNEGTLTLEDVTISECVSDNQGGGIWNDSTITVTDCTVNGCNALAGNGGGIYNTGTFTAENLSVFSNNTSGDGGGVYNEGTYTHTLGNINSNSSAGLTGGGGVNNTGTVTLVEVGVFDNECNGNGHGILNTFGTVTLTRCAVYNNDDVNIYNDFGTLTAVNTTISGGGTVLTAISNTSGTVNLSHCTITQHSFGFTNDGGVLTLYNTILAGNSGNDYDGLTVGAVSLGHNILGVDSIEPITEAAGDIRVLSYAALVVGPMQGNGGPTFTHALLPTSPALDTGDNASAPATDQRGYTRVVNDTIDIGAYEADSEPDPEPPDPDPDPDPEPEPEPEPTPVGETGLVDCRRVTCCNSTSGVEFNDFTYSLVNGQTYTNEETTFIINCPLGYDCTADSVQVTIPAGTIKFTPATLNPNPPKSGEPWNPASGTYEFSCGGQTLSITTDGNGFTQEQLDAILNFLSQCQATQDGYAELLPTPVLTPGGLPGIRLWNTEQTCTVECPEGETGDPVTVTIPAKTNSVIVAQSATALAKYLAQQQINTDTYNQACAEAESQLACTPEAVCPEAKSQIVTGAGTGVTACQYALNHLNLMFVMGDYSGALGLRAYDTADVEQLSSDFAGYSANQNGLCYSVVQDRLYVYALETGPSEARLKVLEASDLSQVTEIDINPVLFSSTSLPRYIEPLDSVVILSGSGILLVDCATNTISQSDATGDLSQCAAAYAQSSSQFYHLANNSPVDMIVRNASLSPVGSIALTGYYLPLAKISTVYTSDGKIITAANAEADDTVAVFVIDPQTDTLTNTVVCTSQTEVVSVDYDPTFNLVYITTDTTLIVFDATNETVICEPAFVFSTAQHWQTGVNTTTDRFYFSSGNAAGTINKWGQP